MIIIHGDNTKSSREHLNQQIASFQSKGFGVQRLSGKKITGPDIIQALEGGGLLQLKNALIVEGLLTRPNSKDKTTCLDYLNRTQPEELVLWEAKKLTASQIKPLATAKIHDHKASQTVFQFLDSLGSHPNQSISLLKQSLKTNPPGLIIYLLAKHFRSLLQISEPTFNISPWQRKKFTNQFNSIGLSQLIYLHENLMQIDYRHKTGQSANSLELELELFVLRLYHKMYEKV